MTNKEIKAKLMTPNVSFTMKTRFLGECTFHTNSLDDESTTTRINTNFGILADKVGSGKTLELRDATAVNMTDISIANLSISDDIVHSGDLNNKITFILNLKVLN